MSDYFDLGVNRLRMWFVIAAVYLIGAIAAGLFFATIYVAVHFISKYW